MKLYTSVNISPSEKKIGYKDKILLLGSCFADNIGAKFAEHYFQNTINPYGTLYNPASIAKAVLDIGYRISDISLVEHKKLWHSLAHHGSFSHMDKEILIQRCEDANRLMNNALNTATTIIVTFGTAWVYEYEGQVVANCHKLPANRFAHRSMTVNEIVALWQPIVASMPDKQWIFTVSPIRHIKDGLHANQLSKAILLQAIDQLCRLSTRCHQLSYFPAYEIMLDELRDYRFYADDMIHPAPVAVNYIWQRLAENCMSTGMQQYLKEYEPTRKSKMHKAACT